MGKIISFLTLGNLGFLVIVIVGIFGAIKFGGKQFIINAVYKLMVQAETELGSGEGEAKLERALSLYDNLISSLPSIPRFILKALFPKSKIISYIEKLVHSINTHFRSHYVQEVESKVEIIDKFKNKALEISYFDNKDIVGNGQIEGIAEDLKGEVFARPSI